MRRPVRAGKLSDDELIEAIELALAVDAGLELHTPVQTQMHRLAAGVLTLFDYLTEVPHLIAGEGETGERPRH